MTRLLAFLSKEKTQWKTHGTMKTGKRGPKPKPKAPRVPKKLPKLQKKQRVRPSRAKNARQDRCVPTGQQRPKKGDGEF